MPDRSSPSASSGVQPEDPFDLQRFVTAQALVMDAVLSELAAGRKTSHWMWFVFPQLRGLGSSTMAHLYGIASAQEAAAYLEHPILGPRLTRCTELLLSHPGRSAHDILGSPDDLKFWSCVTLFHAAGQGREPVFALALKRFFEGQSDPRTIALLAQARD